MFHLITKKDMSVEDGSVVVLEWPLKTTYNDIDNKKTYFSLYYIRFKCFYIFQYFPNFSVYIKILKNIYCFSIKKTYIVNSNKTSKNTWYKNNTTSNKTKITTGIQGITRLSFLEHTKALHKALHDKYESSCYIWLEPYLRRLGHYISGIQQLIAKTSLRVVDKSFLIESF